MQIEGQVVQVNLDDIIPNRFQPRIAFDEKALNELASSIKEHGIIQPLVLRKLGKKYEIIAGERRYKAATLAGLTTVPAVISNIDDNSSAEVALVENIQRRDLTPIEEARSYKNLLDKGYLTQEQLAKKMGLSQSAISNKLRLLNLDNKVQQALLDGKISERHARALLTLNNKEDQVAWLDKIINERITVRDLDQRLKEANVENATEDDIPLVDLTPNIEEIQQTATDIVDNKPKNIDNLLVSENTMTEYSDDLPTRENNNDITEVLEPNEVKTDDPFANIMSNKQEDKKEKTQNFRFFNNIKDEPDELENINPFATDNIFDIQDNETSLETTEKQKEEDNNIEIFDINEPKEEKIKEVKEEVISTPTYDELNVNNRFFQPIMDEPINEIETQSNLTSDVINPMDFVDNIDTKEEIKVDETLPTAINQVRDLISKLNNSGLKVTIDEADLDKNYQIIISIEK